MKILILSFLLLLTGLFYGCKKDTASPAITGFTLTSEAVSDGVLGDKYKCEKKVNDVENSIPLKWYNTPENAGSLAIVMYHYPNPDDHVTPPNTYLFLWDIAPDVMEIPYATAGNGPWYMGPNKDSTAISYTSPCSHGPGTHHYIIKLLALSETPASFPQKSTMAMSWEIFEKGVNSVNKIDSALLEFDAVTP